MLRHTLLWAVVLWGTAGGTASATPWADNLFDGLYHDFGTTPYGPTVNHTFIITNTTGKKVHIVSVRVSCGCLSTALTRTELAPGEEAALVVNMDTRRFRGPFAKSVYVLFDQPETAEVRLTLQANSREDLSLLPTSLAFGQVAPGSEAKAKLTLTFGDGKSEIVDIKCDSGYIEPRVTLLSRESGAVTYEVTAKVRPNLPAGSWYSTVWLTTNNPAMSRLSIPLTVEVQAPKKAPASAAAEPK